MAALLVKSAGVARLPGTRQLQLPVSVEVLDGALLLGELAPTAELPESGAVVVLVPLPPIDATVPPVLLLVLVAAVPPLLARPPVLAAAPPDAAACTVAPPSGKQRSLHLR